MPGNQESNLVTDRKGEFLKMVYELTDTTKVAPLFEGWPETLIWSCLQKVMGKIYVTDSPGSFTYTTKYKIHDVASYTSPDGKYELLFQQVGDPDWPFGHTHARLVLQDEAGTIAKYSFDIADDGANASSDLCQVTWKATQVEAVISGEEQNDNQYILYFNGKTESNQLDTRFGI